MEEGDDKDGCLMGQTGLPGPIGDPGDVGMPGFPGPSGSIGPPGSPGSGPPGPPGSDGVAGLQGPRGPPGSVGSTGIPGFTGQGGYIGPDGPTGPNGVKGSAGPSGPQGLTGVIGADGPTGIAGLVGVRGQPGLQLTQIPQYYAYFYSWNFAGMTRNPEFIDQSFVVKSILGNGIALIGNYFVFTKPILPSYCANQSNVFFYEAAYQFDTDSISRSAADSTGFATAYGAMLSINRGLIIGGTQSVLTFSLTGSNFWNVPTGYTSRMVFSLDFSFSDTIQIQFGPFLGQQQIEIMEVSSQLLPFIRLSFRLLST